MRMDVSAGRCTSFRIMFRNEVEYLLHQVHAGELQAHIASPQAGGATMVPVTTKAHPGCTACGMHSRGGPGSLGGSMMSVSPGTQALSNPVPSKWAITVIVIVLVLSPAVSNVVAAYANAIALVTTLAGADSAAAYRNHRNRV